MKREEGRGEEKGGERVDACAGRIRTGEAREDKRKGKEAEKRRKERKGREKETCDLSEKIRNCVMKPIKPSSQSKATTSERSQKLSDTGEQRRRSCAGC